MDTSFRKGVPQLPINIHNFAVNLHGFCKLSSARYKDYSHQEDMTEVTAHYFLRHSSVCWLTMKYVLIRIIEQWPNLKEYFITFLSKQKEFKQTIKETKRYRQIVEVFENELALSSLSFVSFFSPWVWKLFTELSIRRAINSHASLGYVLPPHWLNAKFC